MGGSLRIAAADLCYRQDAVPVTQSAVSEHWRIRIYLTISVCVILPLEFDLLFIIIIESYTECNEKN